MLSTVIVWKIEVTKEAEILESLDVQQTWAAHQVTEVKTCGVKEAKEGLENELWRKWSNGRVGEWAVT